MIMSSEINREKLIYLIKLLLVFLLIIMSISIAYAAPVDGAKNVINDAFLKELSKLVTNILKDSTIRTFIEQLMIAFVFFIIIYEIAYFLYSGIDIPRLFEKTVWCVVAFLVLQFYDPIISALWGVAEGLGADIQYVAVGNRDPYFLPSWSAKMFGLLITEDVDIWDSMKIIMLAIVWTFVSSLLNLILMISSFFAVLGYALAKITGIFFIPFIIFQGTRSYFDGWLKFFLGFVILAIVLRVNAIIIALLIKAQCLSVIGSEMGFITPSLPVYLSLETNPDLLGNLIFTGIVGIIFIISSFSFASALASGSGSASGSIGRGISGMRQLIFK